MLHLLIAQHRHEILRRCRTKVQARHTSAQAPADLTTGVSRFLDQLVDTLQRRLTSSPETGQVAAQLEADGRGIGLTVRTGQPGVMVVADRRILAAVIVNLLQNALKFTRPRSHVILETSATAERVSVDASDECGGLAEGATSDLFEPYAQHNADRSGLGLGLAFSRWGAAVNRGQLSVRNVVDHGCVFTDLPRHC